MCSHLCPYSANFFLRSYLLFCLGFRTSSFLFVPPCYCSSSWVLLGTGYSSWCSMAKDSCCLPFVSILVSLSVPNLPPYFSISIAIQFFSLGAFGQRNLLVSRSSLLSPLLSVLRSGGFGDRTQVPSVFVLVSLLHSHMWLFSLGASGAQYAPCPLSVSVLVPLVLSNSCPYFSLFLSLSLAVLLSRCLFGHMILSGSSLALPCSLQRVSVIPSSLLLLLLGEEWISWPLVFLLNFSSFVQVTFPYPRSLPHVPLPSVSTTCYPAYGEDTFLLVSNLSPYSLSPLPCFFPGLHKHYRIWDRLGEDSFSPLSFLCFLVPVVFPSAFFTSLLIPVVLAFGTQDSSLSPMCFHLCPYSASFFLFAVWSRL